MVSSPRSIARPRRIFRFTSRSEVSTPAELSMKSVLIRPPVSAYSILPALREAEVATLPNDPSAHLVAVDPHRVVRAVADLGVALVRRLHVRADAAVPEQIDGSLQHPPDHVRRRHLRGRVIGDRERRPHLRRERHPFRGAVDHVGPLGEDRSVVVAPRRSRQSRTGASAPRTTSTGSGSGSRKTCR